MGKGPGLFSEIGKKAKDVLTKDYIQDHKVTISTRSETGLGFTTTGVKKGEAFIGEVVTNFKKKNVTTDIKLTNSNIVTTITVDDFAPGFKSIFKFTIPDPNSGKVEVQYHHDNACIVSNIGLMAVPVVEMNATIGSGRFALGGEAAFDTNTGAFTKYNAGFGVNESDFSAALLLMDKGDTLKASYLHHTSVDKKTSVVAEIAHKISKNENTFTVGSSHALDPITLVKTRVNNYGKVAALVQHEWRPKSTLTLSAEFDTKALDKPAQIGLALALKP